MSSRFPSNTRIFLIDDHPVVRTGVAVVLEQEGLHICGQAGDRATALQALPDAAPDLILLDLTLGEDDSIALLRELLEAAPGRPVLVYSLHEDTYHIERSFAAGAHGYVTKREMAGVLLEAIEHVLLGAVYMSPIAARSVASKLVRAAVASTAPTAELTPQEQRVYGLIAQGGSTADIADELGLSRRTVETYFSRMQIKLGLGGMKELRRHAIAHSGRVHA